MFSKNFIGFIECEDRGWFKRLPIFTQIQILKERDKQLQSKRGLTYDEYKEIKTFKNDL